MNSSSTSVNTQVGWVHGPNGRGTASLVISCVVTLGLCAWSALHLNIPAKGEGQRQYWIRNVKWLLLGVFIPELVILAAWRQWASARELHREIRRILDSEEGLRCSKVSSTNTCKQAAEEAEVRPALLPHVTPVVVSSVSNTCSNSQSPGRSLQWK